MPRKTEFDVLVSFQEIIAPQGLRLDVAEVLDAVLGLELEARNVELGGDVVRLEEATDVNGVRVYDLVKLRMNDQAETGRTTERSAELDLDDDEGLAEHTLFCVVPASNVVGVARTQYGLQAQGIANYVAKMLRPEPELDVAVVQTTDPMARAEAIERPTKLRFVISRPSVEASRNPVIQILRDRLAGLMQAGGNTITVEIALGRKAGAIERDVAMDYVRGFNRSEALISMDLCGERRDGTKDAIDFLTNRLTEAVRINIAGNRRGLSPSDRAFAVREAFRKHQAYLARYIADREV